MIINYLRGELRRYRRILRIKVRYYSKFHVEKIKPFLILVSRNVNA